MKTLQTLFAPSTLWNRLFSVISFSIESKYEALSMTTKWGLKVLQDRVRYHHYRSQAIIKPSLFPHPSNHPLTPYIRHSIRHSYSPLLLSPNDHFSFQITFLGTGSGGIPNADRIASSNALRIGNNLYIFDAGEGIQRQIFFSNIRGSIGDITKIFISHLHGDHVFGLVGLLLNIQLHAIDNLTKKNKLTKPVCIYGPVGLYNFITMNLSLTNCKLRMKLIVYELKNENYNHSIQRNSNFSSELRNCQRRTIYPKNGIWIIPPSSHCENNTPIIKAAELVHVPNVQTFGYVITESIPERTILPDRAIALGLQPGSKYRQLKQGTSVWNDAKSRIIHPDDVLDKIISPRSMAYLCDTSGTYSSSLKKICRNVDICIHEATLVDGFYDKQECLNRGHSTASVAGSFAQDINADVLVLTHISQRNISQKDFDQLIVNAVGDENPLSNWVVVAYDFMELSVPKGGFKSTKKILERKNYKSVKKIF